jgi:hypothetical protein
MQQSFFALSASGTPDPSDIPDSARMTRISGKTAKPEMPGFESFYLLYPRKEARGDARKAWKQKVQSMDDVQSVIDGLKRQLPALLAKERRYLKLPATWLRAECWLDELEPQQGAQQGKTDPFAKLRRMASEDQ